MDSTIKLRALTDQDIIYIQEWMRDIGIMRWFQLSDEASEEKNIKQFIKNAKIDVENEGDIHYAIVDESNEYMGTVSLKNIDREVGKAEYAIVLRRKAIGKGIGEKATRIILEKAFTNWNLNRIYLNVISDNKNAIRMYKKCGFVFEGEFKNHMLIQGKLNSLKWYAVLKENYVMNNLK